MVLIQMVKKTFFLISVVLKNLLIVVYWLIFFTLPFYLLFIWNFKHIDKLIEFFKYSLWPFVMITFIYLFRNNIGNLIDEITELDIFGNKARRNKLPNQQEIPGSVKKIPEEYKGLYLEYKDKTENLSKNVSTLQKELMGKNIELDFEKIYNVIFGSQLNLLDLLTTTTTISLTNLTNYFQRVQQKNPIFVVSNWSLTDYIRFIDISKLIESVPDGFQITLKGRMFMLYIKTIRKYNLSKLN